jgi:hypothetical protein
MEDPKTNFDRYLERKFQDANFRARFEAADQAWDTATGTMTPPLHERPECCTIHPAASATASQAGRSWRCTACPRQNPNREVERWRAQRAATAGWWWRSS